MEWIRRFLLDESATAEGTSTVIMVAAVLILFGAGMLTYYNAIGGFFTSTETAIGDYAGRAGPAF